MGLGHYLVVALRLRDWTEEELKKSGFKRRLFGDRTWKRRLLEDEITMGIGEGRHIQIPNKTGKVSHYHAIIKKRPNNGGVEYHIQDRSKNGTIIYPEGSYDNQFILTREDAPRKLRDGDQIVIGYPYFAYRIEKSGFFGR